MCIRDRARGSDKVAIDEDVLARLVNTSRPALLAAGVAHGLAPGEQPRIGEPVSYTHLDVYKRQGYRVFRFKSNGEFLVI